MSRVRRPRSTVLPPPAAPPHRPTTARALEPATHSSSPGRIALAVFVLLAGSWLACGWSADPRAWGVHLLAFLPRAYWFVALALFAALLAPGIAARVGEIGLRGTAGIVGAGARTVWVALGAGGLFYLLRLPFQFLGDGIVWQEKIETRGTFHHFEPLATVLVAKVARLASTVPRGIIVPSIACGVLALPLTAHLCRSLWSDRTSRALAWCLLVVHPLLLLFFGYVESYPLLYVLQLVFAIALLSDGKGGAAIATLVLAVAIATHLQAVAWLPALLLLPWARRGLAGAARGRALAEGGVLAALAVGVSLVLIHLSGASIAKLLAELGGESALGSARTGILRPGRRLLDVGNELALVLGSGLLVAAPAIAARRARREPGASVWRDSRWVRIAALVPGPALFVLVVVPRIGGARDWDLYLSIVLPVTLLAVEGWRRWRAAATHGRVPDVVAGRALGFALVATIAWLWVNLEAPRAARRMIVLQSPHGTYGNFARGYANEALGIYFRSRDLQGARDAYVRATEANPKNARYFNNLANVELQLHNLPAARRAFRSAYDLGMKEWFVLQNLGVCAMQLDEPDSAAVHFTELTRRFPDRWLGHACLAQAQIELGRPREALAALDRAAALAPKEADVPYFAGLAHRDLGEHDAARRAFAAALQLDPRHALARQALEALPRPAP